MNYSSIENVIVTVYDLCHKIKCLMLWESFFISDEFGQIPLITKLRNDVGIVFSSVNVVDFNDILGVFKVFENLHLWYQ